MKKEFKDKLELEMRRTHRKFSWAVKENMPETAKEKLRQETRKLETILDNTRFVLTEKIEK